MAAATPQAATPHAALSARSLYDAHCHPQVEGQSALELLPNVQAGGLAVMATRREDWPLVAQLHEQSPQRGAPTSNSTDSKRIGARQQSTNTFEGLGTALHPNPKIGGVSCLNRNRRGVSQRGVSRYAR